MTFASRSRESARLSLARDLRMSFFLTTHGISQASLKSAMSLSKLAEPCAALGMNIDGAAKSNDRRMTFASRSRESARLSLARDLRMSFFLTDENNEITRTHGISQASLKSAMSLSKLAEPCAALGMNIDLLEVANLRDLV
jgi:hypothetical protein